MDRRGKLQKVKAKAKRPPVRKSKGDSAKPRDLVEKRLAEALEQLQTRDHELAEALAHQTATSEILRAIAGVHADVQPVFDMVAENAVRLCGGFFSAVFVSDGVRLHLRATHNLPPAWMGEVLATSAYPAPLDSELRTVLVVRERRVIQIDDFQNVGGTESERAQIGGFRTWVGIPMLAGSEAIGTLAVSRRERRAFSESEIALLQTFADQAVIAIENVRLFQELEVRNAKLTESLAQQTATSDVLKVISRSAFDLDPVLQTLVDNATRLCNAQSGVIWKFDGEVFRLAAERGVSEELKEAWARNPFGLGRGTATGRTALEGRTIHIPDVLADPEYTLAQAQKAGGFRTILGVPMLRDDVLVGVFGLQRYEVLPFTERQIELVRTFADQSAIAIENVRLFEELETRTHDLTRSVEQLTALGEVGHAVSSTLNLETVLTTIVTRAVRLSGLDGGVVSEYDEATEEFVQRAAAETGGVLAQALRGVRYRKGEGAIGRTAITREPVQVADITVPGAYDSRVRADLIESGTRAVLAVPMIHQDRLIGCLGVTRNRPGDFPTETIELMKAFATQSALAIQNARLFHEIEAKSREVQVASQHKSEFLANMSHELRTPLNAIIGYSELLEEEAGDLDGGRLVPDLQKIATAAKHQLSLINDILDLSKVEAGRMELEVADFDLPTAIESALTLVRERATRRGIALGSTIDERIGSIQADERKVKQVLLNLLSNAIKFTPEGGRSDVRAAINDGMIEVSVADTGVGIAPKDQEKVFEEFRQVGTSDKKIEGTGLGLTLCRKFVELHGGRIWVKSQVGQGSTFTFTLPGYAVRDDLIRLS
jgi:signal transduction histidine kinase